MTFFGIAISALKALTPELLRRLPDVWKAGDVESTYRIPVYIACVWIFSAVLRYYHLFWMLYISELVAVNMRRKLMNKYLDLNLGFFQNFVRGSGGLISRMLNDVGVIQGGFQKIADIVREPFMIFILAREPDLHRLAFDLIHRRRRAVDHDGAPPFRALGA